MAVIGVRISWLMLARNSLLARLAASAAILAFSRAFSAFFRSEMSRTVATLYSRSYFTNFKWTSTGNVVPSLRRLTPSHLADFVSRQNFREPGKGTRVHLGIDIEHRQTEMFLATVPQALACPLVHVEKTAGVRIDHVNSVERLFDQGPEQLERLFRLFAAP